MALTESVALNWNSDNVGAYLPARAPIETIALLLDLEHELKKHIAASDIDALNALFDQSDIATRHKKWIEGNPESEAINVITLIDRMDKRTGSGVRGHYYLMSERCHPNYLGHHQLYGTLDVGTTSFSETKNIERHRGCFILGAILLLLLDEHCIDGLDNEVDRVAALQNAYCAFRGSLKITVTFAKPKLPRGGATKVPLGASRQTATCERLPYARKASTRVGDEDAKA
ncbi:hypothetical protein [Bradyrhizobium sp. sBnM-33]|uniref:hypothetical protein n=1 Tax=Bradyrhizobium sp. sBnM-33 TaxID=2831780 RepID=UPI001BCD18FC|nr:hypothetical protein [Bradyrhizobium sp. sBnM-33]WOH53790.1 hypothetical protein RX328_17880 [Bradyrhizobium sp. sBnM-33]